MHLFTDAQLLLLKQLRRKGSTLTRIRYGISALCLVEFNNDLSFESVRFDGRTIVSMEKRGFVHVMKTSGRKQWLELTDKGRNLKLVKL